MKKIMYKILSFKNKISKKLYYRKVRKGVTKDDITIFANDCCGGVIYHQLGKKFCSPFINLFVSIDEFIKFSSNPLDYLNGSLEEIKEKSVDYPVGKLVSSTKNDFITLNFMHYKTFFEAQEKWNERKERIVQKQYFIFNLTNFDDINFIKNKIFKINSLNLQNCIVIVNKITKIKGKNVVSVDFKNEEFFTSKIISSYKKPWIIFIDQIVYKNIFKSTK